MTGFDIAAVNVEKREYQKEYMDYWNSTASLTGTGRAIDAVITPLAPMPANLTMKFDYIGMLLSYYFVLRNGEDAMNNLS